MEHEGWLSFVQNDMLTNWPWTHWNQHPTISKGSIQASENGSQNPMRMSESGSHCGYKVAPWEKTVRDLLAKDGKDNPLADWGAEATLSTIL